MRWLHADEELQAGRMALARLVERMLDLRPQLQVLGYDVGGRATVQAACYPGGGARYVRHRDASESAPGRCLTAICYLNPGWDAKVRLPGLVTMHPAVLLPFSSTQHCRCMVASWPCTARLTQRRWRDGSRGKGPAAAAAAVVTSWLQTSARCSAPWGGGWWCLRVAWSMRCCPATARDTHSLSGSTEARGGRRPPHWIMACVGGALRAVALPPSPPPSQPRPTTLQQQRLQRRRPPPALVMVKATRPSLCPSQRTGTQRRGGPCGTSLKR
jgi:hypothetical protein